MGESMPSAPGPMSVMPAFSPGPQTTSLLRVGNIFRWMRELLYEQCSLHITLKMPNSVMFGSRPRMDTIRSYSSGVNWCAWTISGVIWLMTLFSWGELTRVGLDQRLEHQPAVARSHQRFSGPFRMRHHAHHVAAFVQHAGDVAQRAV